MPTPIRHFDKDVLRADLVAGVSVAAVAVPISIAYAQLAGMPPANGLYASILPLIAYAVFGSSRQLIMAPDAATCAIVASVVLPLAGADRARYISLSMALAMITGIFCIVAGRARLGFITNFLARPILTGYLNGIAISIIAGQLGRLFGFQVNPGGVFRTLADFVSKLGQTHWPTLLTGVGIFALLRVLKRLAPRVPAPLVAVALGAAVAFVLHLDRRGVALLGTIPAGLPRLIVPDVQASDLGPLALGAIGLTLISFSSAMVTARSFAVKNRYEIDANREFVALGVADIGAGLLQGFAVSGADSRTAVNDAVGGRTQMTSIVAAGVLLLVLFFFTTPLAFLPISALAAVLINSALGLFDFQNLARLRRISRQEFWLAMVTLLGVVTVGVLPAVIVAIGLAFLQLLIHASRPPDAILGRVPGLDGFHSISGRPTAETIPGVVIYRFGAALVFFNADHFKSRVRAAVDGAAVPPRWLVLDAGTMPIVDSTGAAILQEMRDELGRRGIELVLAEAKTPVRAMLEKTGLAEDMGPERMFPTIEGAVLAITRAQDT
jgi:high affinity sulfate transporter 1